MSNQYMPMSPAYIRRKHIEWKIRDDYLAMREEREAIIEGSPAPPDGMPVGRSVTNPTLNKAVRLAIIDQFISAVESALVVIPDEYREGVWNHVLYGGRYPCDAARSTYEKWTRRYLAAVASRL